jgi:hypothetical protein
MDAARRITETDDLVSASRLPSEVGQGTPVKRQEDRAPAMPGPLLTGGMSTARKYRNVYGFQWTAGDMQKR